MALSEKEMSYIVDTAVEILRSPERKQRIDELRQRVMSEDVDRTFELDDAVYSVLQALEELYGD